MSKINEIEKYFGRKRNTIHKSIIEMAKNNYGNSFVIKNNDEVWMSKEGLEWLCKNCFKQKYLELLEIYKMELTEKYIEAGYIYDEFFYLN